MTTGEDFDYGYHNGIYVNPRRYKPSEIDHDVVLLDADALRSGRGRCRKRSLLRPAVPPSGPLVLGRARQGRALQGSRQPSSTVESANTRLSAPSGAPARLAARPPAHLQEIVGWGITSAGVKYWEVGGWSLVALAKQPGSLAP